MKKEIISMAIMAAGLLVASCGNKSEAPVAEAEQAEQVVEETIPEEQPASLADIVAKLQQVPQGDWFLTEVTVPRVLRSNFAGNVSAFDFQSYSP